MFLSTWFKAPGLVYLFSLHQIITLYWQSEDKNFRRGSTWRRQFPPREVHGISMMPGSSETLPAGFRLTTTSGQSRKMATDGTVVLHLCL